MHAPRVRVLLGSPEDTKADIVVLPGHRPGHDGRIVTVTAPRWRPPNGPEHLLAESYRRAVEAANASGARSMALPAILALGPWPLDNVTRVALTVLNSTPTTLTEVFVAARTPAMVERWAEALAREPDKGNPPTGWWR